MTKNSIDDSKEKMKAEELGVDEKTLDCYESMGVFAMALIIVGLAMYFINFFL